MRFPVLFAALFALTACQTTVNPQGEASPELRPVLEDVVASINASRGEALGPDLTILGASSRGNTVTVNYEARQDLAELFRRLPRGEVENFLEVRGRATNCSDPEARAFIDAGGRFEQRFLDNARRELASVVFDRC